jgi:hypothetical protein
MQYIKQSTAITLKIGPFIDDTDGKTPETALTIAQADVRLSKNGGDIAQKTEATSCTHDELGVYECPIDATDSATLGRLQLFVIEAGALPVWHEYTVLSPNAFDTLFGSDKLEVDLVQIAGEEQSATDLKDFADAGYDPLTNKVEGVKLADVSAVNADVIADLLTIKQPAAGAYDRATDSLEAIRDRGDAAWSAAAGNPNVLLDTTIATLASQTSFTLTAGSDDDDAYKDQAIVLYDASNNDYPSVRKISAYAGATKTVTLDSAPDFIALVGDGVKTFVTAPGTTAPTAEQVADAVLDESTADHIGAGSLSKAIRDTLEDTGTTIPGTITPLQSDVTDVLADVTGINGDPMRGTEDGALASVCTEERLARLDAAISSRSSHVAADIWAVGTRALTDKVDFELSAAAIAAIFDEVIEDTASFRKLLRIFTAALAGKSTGGGTATVAFRDIADLKDRIVATVDEHGNRTAISVDGT